MTDNEKKLEELKVAKDKYRDQAFLYMIKLLVVFGVPVAIAYFVGTHFDNQAGGGHLYVLICLAVSLIISWVITFFIYRNLNKKIKNNEQAIDDQEEAVKNERVEHMLAEKEKTTASNDVETQHLASKDKDEENDATEEDLATAVSELENLMGDKEEESDDGDTGGNEDVDDKNVDENSDEESVEKIEDKEKIDTDDEKTEKDDDVETEIDDEKIETDNDVETQHFASQEEEDSETSTASEVEPVEKSDLDMETLDVDLEEDKK